MKTKEEIVELTEIAKKARHDLRKLGYSEKEIEELGYEKK